MPRQSNETRDSPLLPKAPITQEQIKAARCDVLIVLSDCVFVGASKGLMLY